MLSLRNIVALAVLASVATVAGCNGILGIDQGHLDDQDAGMMTADGGMMMTTDSAMALDGASGPCSFDNPNSKFDKGCTFAP